MTLPYSMRLACLCLEVLLLVHVTVSAFVLLLSPRLRRAAEVMRPQRAAQLFLGVRLLPFSTALAVVALLCAPSYLRFEDNTGAEPLGLACLAMAALGAALCLSCIARAFRALLQLRQLNRLSVAQTHPASIADTALCVTEHDAPGAPLLALVGILHPRFIVSRRLLQALSPEQLQAALCHERAHLQRHDNLKRLLIALAPGILPFASGFASIERQWGRYAELAADDNAAESRAGNSIALAEALLQVARLANGTHPMPLASSLSDSSLDLARRVNRLLLAGTAASTSSRKSPSPRGQLLATAALLSALIVLLPQLSATLYPLLETLLH